MTELVTCAMIKIALASAALGIIVGYLIGTHRSTVRNASEPKRRKPLELPPFGR